MPAIHGVPGGLSALPLAVILLFAAPITALLAGFFVMRPFKPEWTHGPILASCAVVAAAGVWLAARVYTGWGIDVPVGTWMLAGDWGISFGVRLDGLSASVLAMVSVVGALIHVYASGYMKGDPGFPRFFLLFHLFYLSMIGLLVSNNYVQLYLFWELVGMCSYFLIGYWHHKKPARQAALQAFLTNRIGDFGLMLAVLILLAVFRHGNTRFAVLFPLVTVADPGILALTGLLIFWAACAKSAQFPLYFWLPDAMEGPTPVSALMHAATMVTAGIFLLARSWPLISSIGHLPQLIGWVGAATALGAATIAATRSDLKRILAYSTVSHLGLMAFALGMGQVGAAIFHLITHGFFKAVLFLCAGNIAHALGQPTVSVSEVGGLAKKMPLTFVCFSIAALSLAGVWPFAGFYSKDAILDAALEAGGLKAGVGLAIAAASSFYIFRMLFLAFLGPRPEQKGPRAHEAPAVMGVPLLFLSLGALGAGWLSRGFSAMILSGWPTRAAIPGLPHFSLPVFLAGSAMAALGAGAAFWLTTLLPGWDWDWRRRFPGLEGLFQSDFGWKTVVGLAAEAFAGAARRFGLRWDEGIWDGAVERTADVARSASEAGGMLATGSVNDYLWWMLAGTAALLAAVLR